MKNLIVLGSGRSGTSAVAGLFRNEPGVFYGYDILEPSGGNQTGYYECEVVNTINNILLRQLTGVSLLDHLPQWPARLFERFLPWTHRDVRSLWLARPRRQPTRELSYDIAHLIGRMSRHQPFCFKDPRFGFTLPLWQPYLPPDVRYLVVFRDPADAIASILRDAKESYDDRPLAVTEQWAVEHWKLIYQCILSQRRVEESQWMFLNFNDVLTEECQAALTVFVGAKPDTEQLEPARIGRHRARAGNEGDDCRTLYDELCNLARDDLQLLTTRH